jgi:UPF0755 protein
MNHSMPSLLRPGPGLQRGGLIRVLLILMALVAVIAGPAGLWGYTEYRRFIEQPLALPEEGLHYAVRPGSSVRTIAEGLTREGVLEHPEYLVWYARWHDLAPRLKAGEYHIPAGTTAPQLLERMVSGRVVQHSLTLVEGWTFRQVMAAVQGHPALEQGLQGLSDEEIMARLGREGEHPEGRFFPDTYHFPRGTTDLAFLSRAYEAMERRLAAAWEGRVDGLPYANPYEALILASIVEKEARLPEERPHVAGVFVRRLQIGMRLQTDPTVIYGFGDEFEGRLRTRHLRDPHPYNTYVHGGLPPTPIAMPGAGALEAVMHPADGATLYFVARGDGSHHFSESLEEHNRAVRKYILGR